MGTCGTDRDFLMHYGVAGMRWGVRRYTNSDGSLNEEGLRRYGLKGDRSAKGMARDLNRLDREITKANYYSERYGKRVNNKIAKAQQKLAKAKASGNITTAAKAQAKITKLSNSSKKQKSDQYKELAKRSQALSDKIIKKALKKKFSVKSRDTLRVVNAGETVLTNLLSSGVAVSSGRSHAAGMTASVGRGKKYKVKNDGRGSRTHRSDLSYTNKNAYRRSKGYLKARKAG